MLFPIPFVNPITLLFNGVSIAYIASWPVIINNFGQDALMTQSLVLITLMLICDIGRGFALRRVGFDFMSVPLGLAVLSGLNSKPGAIFLTFVKPFYNFILFIMRPTLLLIETYLVHEILKKFNQWISGWANRENPSVHDLSQWERPLATSSIIARVFVVIITLMSYIWSYHLIVRSQHSMLQVFKEIPGDFDQAIIILVTLQFIAAFWTLVKDDGIISEPAMICCAASLCIFAASLHQSQVLISGLFESGLIAVFLMTTSKLLGNRGQSRVSLVSRYTLIKCILLLSYTQMLIQQHNNNNYGLKSRIFGLEWNHLVSMVKLFSGQSVDPLNQGISFGEERTNSPTAILGGLWNQLTKASSVTNEQSYFETKPTPLSASSLWSWQAFDEIWIQRIGLASTQRLVQSILLQLLYIIAL